MNVGKDPFPQDEVTGLAAFEHIEPVRTLNVLPENSVEASDVSEDSSDDVDLGTAPEPPISGNGKLQPRRPGRGDATLPLDLSAMPHWHEQLALAAPDASENDVEDVVEETEEQVPAAAAAMTGGAVADKPSALDAMFAEVGGAPGWDDEDEATRVHSNPAGSRHRKASLEMEWDEDEPATEMRPGAMFDAPPLAARLDQDEPGWNQNEQDATAHYVPVPVPVPARGPTSIRSATPTIRIATPPLHSTLPPVQAGAKALSGGRPSPFPAAGQAAVEPAVSVEPLVPLTAAPLPAAARPSLWKTASEQLEHSLSAQTPARFIDALKAGHKPSVIIAASGVVGLVALVLIVKAIAAGSPGAAVLETTPADARVEVDGKPVVGTSSPYSVSELAPGTHEITVNKAGYNDYRGSFAVTGGQTTKLPLIELSANLRDVGFSVRSVPPGASVWLDGERTDQVTPAKLTGIKPGIHRLALKQDGYTDYELQMFVPEATVLQLPAAELVAQPSAAPEPAHVGRRSRRASSSDDDDSYSARRSRRASSSDASDTERSERKSYTSSYGSRSKQRAADADDDVLSGSRSSSAAASGKTGTLRLNSRPWSQVAVDGKPVGNTPQQNLQLSAGKHKVQLSNTQLGLTKTVSVTIKAGETLTQVVNLAER